jgi:hypothetical protein
MIHASTQHAHSRAYGREDGRPKRPNIRGNGCELHTCMMRTGREMSRRTVTISRGDGGGVGASQ